jgi:pSer/pThr/pTyr-binding forkhead associated (FHA) protein
MRDGQTREMKAAGSNSVFSQFLSKFQASIVILSGAAKGTEHTLDSERVTIGRGPGVDLAFDDSAMSREHAAIEFGSGGFRLRDLGSTNGTLLNGGEVKASELKHKDKFQVGEYLFQFVVEERKNAVPTYELPDDS